MYEDVEPVDLDAVDDDRDVDTDAASAEPVAPSGELPGASRSRRGGRGAGGPYRNPAAVAPPAMSLGGGSPSGNPKRTIPKSAVDGAVVGAGAAASAAALRRHPKASVLVAILAAVLALTPAEKRPRHLKRIAIGVAVLAGLFVAFIGLLLVLGVMAPGPSAPVVPAPSAPTSTSSCVWGALC